MKNREITMRQKQLLQIIYNWLKTSGFAPSFDDMKKELGVSSNQAVLDLLDKLEEKKFLKRTEGLARSISIIEKGYKLLGAKPMAQMVGNASCGPLTEAFEQKDCWIELSPEVHQFDDKLFIIKAFGDSMIGAGINDGDMLLVRKGKEFKSGDIVLARTMEGTTVKRLVHKDRKIFFQPENPKYETIPVCDETFILGKIIKNLTR